MRKLSKISAFIVAIGLGLIVSSGMVVPSNAIGSPPVVTIQRVYVWEDYANNPYAYENVVLQDEGLDFTVNVHLPTEWVPLIWTTFDVTDVDCDISSVIQWVESAPPLAFPEGTLPGSIIHNSGWIADDPRYNCGGSEVVIGGLPAIWTGTAGNLFTYYPGQYAFRTEVTDVAGNVTNARFVVNVTEAEVPVNHPPVVVQFNTTVSALENTDAPAVGSPVSGTIRFDPNDFSVVQTFPEFKNYRRHSLGNIATLQSGESIVTGWVENIFSMTGPLTDTLSFSMYVPDCSALQPVGADLSCSYDAYLSAPTGSWVPRELPTEFPGPGIGINGTQSTLSGLSPLTFNWVTRRGGSCQGAGPFTQKFHT